VQQLLTGKHMNMEYLEGTIYQ